MVFPELQLLVILDINTKLSLQMLILGKLHLFSHTFIYLEIHIQIKTFNLFCRIRVFERYQQRLLTIGLPALLKIPTSINLQVDKLFRPLG